MQKYLLGLITLLCVLVIPVFSNPTSTGLSTFQETITRQERIDRVNQLDLLITNLKIIARNERLVIGQLGGRSRARNLLVQNLRLLNSQITALEALKPLPPPPVTDTGDTIPPPVDTGDGDTGDTRPPPVDTGDGDTPPTDDGNTGDTTGDNTGGGTTTGPPTTAGNLPLPPAGTVDAQALIAKIATTPPPNKVSVTFTTQIADGQKNTLFTNNGTHSGSHSILFSPGGGGGGVQASRKAPLVFEDNWVNGLLKNSVGAFTRWGLHAYGVADWKFNRVYWFNIPDEHGVYMKSCWGFEFNENVFSNIGSQGVQCVWRSHEAVDFNAYLDPNGNGIRPLAKFTNNVFLNVGQPSGGRPSYSISLFEVQGGPDFWKDVMARDVLIEGNYMESQVEAHKASGIDGYQSFGAIMVHGHEDVTIRLNTIRHKVPNRAVVQIWNCNNVTIEGNEIGDPFTNSSVLLDIRNTRGTFTLKGNTGNAKVRFMYGPHYTSPTDPQLNLIWQGNVSQDVVLVN